MQSFFDLIVYALMDIYAIASFILFFPFWLLIFLRGGID